jgi:pentatricopeptide repeat protein
VYKDMVWKGLERSVITYSSLISACEKAGRWEAALQLFDEMTRDGCTPNTVTYNSLITACGQGEDGGRACGEACRPAKGTHLRSAPGVLPRAPQCPRRFAARPPRPPAC